MITYEKLLKIAPKGLHLQELADSMNQWFPFYHINTERRINMFLAMAEEETAGFRYFIELGGPNYFKKYDGKLGNTEPGDGYKYRGRGIFQLTGKANYRLYSGLLAVPFLSFPDKAAEPDNAVHIACEYWYMNNLNTYADKDDLITITKKINGGLNGFSRRLAYYKKLAKLHLFV